MTGRLPYHVQQINRQNCDTGQGVAPLNMTFLPAKLAAVGYQTFHVEMVRRAPHCVPCACQLFCPAAAGISACRRATSPRRACGEPCLLRRRGGPQHAALVPDPECIVPIPANRVAGTTCGSTTARRRPRRRRALGIPLRPHRGGLRPSAQPDQRAHVFAPRAGVVAHRSSCRASSSSPVRLVCRPPAVRRPLLALGRDPRHHRRAARAPDGRARLRLLVRQRRPGTGAPAAQVPARRGRQQLAAARRQNSAREGGVRVAAFVSGGWLPRSCAAPSSRATRTWPIGTARRVRRRRPDRRRGGRGGFAEVDHRPWPMLRRQHDEPSRRDRGRRRFCRVFEAARREHIGVISGRWKLLEGVQTQTYHQGLAFPNASSPPHGAFTDRCLSPLQARVLYDILADPTEQHNVALQHLDVVATLRARLDELRPTKFQPDSDSRRSPARRR